MEKTGATTVGKLLFHAKKHGYNPTRADLQAVVQSLGQKQIFLPVRPSKGKVASERPGARWQADLADFKETPDAGNKYFLVLADVFTRQVHAKPLPDKRPETVARVLKNWLESQSVVHYLYTDAGQEWLGVTAEMLQREGVIHQTKTSKLDKNSTAVVDRAIQNLKARMAQLMAKSDLGWTTALAKAVENYGEDFHATVRDEPDQVNDGTEPGKILAFMAYKDNAAKLGHNQKLLERRHAQFEELGAFRKPLESSIMKFQRGHKARYGPVERVQSVEGSKVTGSQGTEMDIKLLLPVSKDSTTARPTFAFSDARKEKKRAALTEGGFLASLDDAIPEEGRIALTTLSKELRRAMPTYTAVLEKAFPKTFGKLAEAIRLFPEDYKMEDNELYVRRVEPN